MPGVNVKGSTLDARMRFIEKRWGETGVKNLLDALPEEDRHRLSPVVLSSNWYPYETYIRVLETIDRLYGHGDPKLIAEIARFAADHNLPRLYKFFYSVSSVRLILSMGLRLWKLNYDAGYLEVKTEDKHVTLWIRDFPQPHHLHCLSVMHWAGRSVELSGATIVRIEEVSCRALGASECRFECEWTD